VNARPSAAPEPPERWIDAAELALTMGVSTRTVARWVSQGCPSDDWGMRCRRFQTSAVIAWARERTTARTIARTRGDVRDVTDLRPRQAKE
jgi:phage terminase Nu1 subunit (DNA packaging protein)